jgi:hypothetical protein
MDDPAIWSAIHRMTVVLDTLGAQQGVQTDGGFADVVNRMRNVATPNYNAIYKKIENWKMLDKSDEALFTTNKEACKTKMDEALKAFTNMVDFMKDYKEKHNAKEKDIPSISL